MNIVGSSAAEIVVEQVNDTSHSSSRISVNHGSNLACKSREPVYFATISGRVRTVAARLSVKLQAHDRSLMHWIKPFVALIGKIWICNPGVSGRSIYFSPQPLTIPTDSQAQAEVSPVRIDHPVALAGHPRLER